MIENSYSRGAVSGNNYIGGLVGFDSDGDTVASFWDVNTSGISTSAAGTGLTTQAMQSIDTFLTAGWDLVGETNNGPNDVWSICDGISYPRLTWQLLAADLACPDGVDFRDYSVFAHYWKQTSDVDGADLTGDGVVNIDDLFVFCRQWLLDSE